MGVTSGPFFSASQSQLMVVAEGTSASQSNCKGPGLTVATAGASATFTITARDSYANDRGLAEDAWAINFIGPSKQAAAAWGDTRVPSNYAPPLTANAYALVQGAGRYLAAYTLTVSGLYTSNILRLSSGGLLAEMYCNSWLHGEPCSTVIDPNIEFNWGSGVIKSPSAPPSPLFGSDYMSFRWSGYFLLESADLVTFYTQTDEGLRLYVDGDLLIDKWQSMGMNYSATWSGTVAGALYSVVLEYRESTGPAYCSLLYSTALVAAQAIPSALLFNSPRHVFGSPFSVYVAPTVTCASLSQVSLSAPFSFYTVGVPASISISTADEYGNVRTSWDVSSPSVFVRVCALDFSDYCKRAMVSKSNPGSWSATFASTRAAASSLKASLVYTDNTFKGMLATYYRTTTIGTGTLKSAVVTIGSGTLSSDTKAEAWGTSANPQPFSARWTGVFVATHRGQYTFSVTIAASDGARLYIGNVRVIDGWSTSGVQSLIGTVFLDVGSASNTFFDVVLDYRRVLNTNGGSVSGFEFRCNNGASTAFSNSLMRPFDIPPSPQDVKFSGGPAVLQQSVFVGLSIATAGVPSAFSVTTKDAFGNLISVGGSSWYVYVSKADGESATAFITDGGNGVYYGTYDPTAEGAYVLSVALGSAATAFSLTVLPGLVCASKSLVLSQHLSVSTSGSVSSFTVTMRDSFGNYRTSLTDNVVARMMNGYDYKTLSVFSFSNNFNTPFAPTYVASYRTSLAGSYTIDVRAATSLGLNASYFVDPNLSQLAVSRVDSTVDFDWGAGSPHPSIGIVDLFSVQWSGYIKPDNAGVYTFVVDIAGTSFSPSISVFL
jgi:hypothetical protein